MVLEIRAHDAPRVSSFYFRDGSGVRTVLLTNNPAYGSMGVMLDPSLERKSLDDRRVAIVILVLGSILTLVKALLYLFTDALSVLADLWISIVATSASAVLLYANLNHDRFCSHQRIGILLVGLQGWLILIGGGVLVVMGLGRLVISKNLRWLEPHWWRFVVVVVLGVIVVVGSVALTIYIMKAAKRFDHKLLRIQANYMVFCIVSTVVAIAALILVRSSGWLRLDPLFSIVISSSAIGLSWRLLWQSVECVLTPSELPCWPGGQAAAGFEDAGHAGGSVTASDDSRDSPDSKRSGVEDDDSRAPESISPPFGTP